MIRVMKNPWQLLYYFSERYHMFLSVVVVDVVFCD